MENWWICKECGHKFEYTAPSWAKSFFMAVNFLLGIAIFIVLLFFLISQFNFLTACLILVFLLFIGFIPYNIRNAFLHYKDVHCPICSSNKVIPVNTPLGKELNEKYYL